MIIDGEMDEYPELAFFNVGTIDEVIEKAKETLPEDGAEESPDNSADTKKQNEVEHAEGAETKQEVK